MDASTEKEGSFRWRALTENPGDGKVSLQMSHYLLARRVTVDVREMGFAGFVRNLCEGKRVLDIGMAEHSYDYVRSGKWQHRRLREVASYVLGVDILAPLVERLKAEGYNVRCVDALSDADLGERFDVVVCGNVIEHVNDPVRLLKFARRHLVPGGKILVATPNPYYWLHILEVPRWGTPIANFEHVSWITPSMALEIGARAGAELRRYYIFDGCRSLLKRLLRRFLPREMTTLEYLYEFA